MISQEAIEHILCMNSATILKPEIMAKYLTITVFPYESKTVNADLVLLKDKLISTLKELGVTILDYDKALHTIPVGKLFLRGIKIITNNIYHLFALLVSDKTDSHFIHMGALINLLKMRRIKPGVSVIVLGENPKSKLPIDYTSSFTNNSVITLLPKPVDINKESEFMVHFNKAMEIFSYHMTHLAILVDSKNWIVYNFNASHPIYDFSVSFKEKVLQSVIPKIAAPIRPPKLEDFVIKTDSFKIDQEPYKSMIDDLVKGSQLFYETKLYPPGKSVNELPFRNGFYRWIGKIHLDHRNGMSYGFLARQIPSKPVQIYNVENDSEAMNAINKGKDYFYNDNKLHIILKIHERYYFLAVPPVWVLTQRSGANKTHVDPVNDLLLLGLDNGKMYLKTPVGSILRRSYRPSFDSKVILAHAVGNSIISSIMNLLADSSNSKKFTNHLSTKGMAIAHWHGYINSKLVPEGWIVHGYDNPHVACSTAQSAIFALQGKLNSFAAQLPSMRFDGDIHIEPHHGVNINYYSITDLARLLLSTPSISQLGNKYLIEH